jgi:hypothetical protein
MHEQYKPMNKDRDAVGVFLHIPRTGGTGLNRILSTYYNTSKIAHIFDQGGESAGTLGEVERVERLINSNNNIDLVTGHFGYGDIKINRPTKFFTLIRDPLERIHSYYKYILTQPDHYLRKYIIDRRLSFDRFALSNSTAELDNFQVRMLCGKPSKLKYNCSIEDLKSAIQNVKSGLIHVGFTDKYEQSCLDILSHLEIKVENPIQFKITNSSNSNVRDLSEEVSRELRKKNSLDCMLIEELRSFERIQ